MQKIDRKNVNYEVKDAVAGGPPPSAKGVHQQRGF